MKPFRIHLRGFASMTPERRSEIAAMGGRSVPDNKRGFSQNRAAAAAAGRKGGKNVPREKRALFKDRELASRLGKLGGIAVPAEKRSFSQNRELAARARWK